MTTTPTTRHQRHAAADRRAHRDRLPDRAGRRAPARTTPTRCPRSRSKSQIPVIADIHFQPKYVFAAIDAGCAAVRVNPGNIKAFDDKVGRSRKAAERRRGPDPHRRQRRLARQAAAGEVRQGHARGAGRVGALGVLAVRGARLPRHQDLGQAQRPGRDGQRLPAARRSSATTRCTSASPRPGPPSRAPSSPRSRSARCSPRASATRSASRCRRLRSRRSRSATRSWSRSASSSAAWRSCPARPAAAPRSTSTPWPTRSPPGSRASPSRCGSP